MTFFKPEQKNFIDYIIAGLVMFCLLVSFGLVYLYNHSVNLAHEISAAEVDIRSIQTAKAQLQDKIFTLLNGINPHNFSKERNLIEEKNPQYIKTAGQTGGELAISQ